MTSPREKTSHDSIAPLSESERHQALEFLAQRPLHTVIMSGWIRDYGVISAHHRGIFYRTVDQRGKITGVALVGRNTFFEVRSAKALREVARLASDRADIKMVFAQEEDLANFWQYYAKRACQPRLKCSEILFDINSLAASDLKGPRLRLATLRDLEPVARAHASMVLDETGVDPVQADPEGFRERCAERIENGRVWVWVKDGELLFKTDVISDTPAACYIEGLWVNPKIRSTGRSSGCLRSLCSKLLNGRNSIVGFVDAQNTAALNLYRRSGFVFRDKYQKVYL